MLVCSQCHHQNPDILSQCEACCADLEMTFCCPNCGSHYLENTKFCGQCGIVLETSSPERGLIASGVRLSDLPELLPPEPEIELYLSSWTPRRILTAAVRPLEVAANESPDCNRVILEDVKPSTVFRAVLVHQDTQFKIELEQYSSPIHLGKPNAQQMPDINLATFKHAEVVSRIHADIVMENRHFFIRDNGSANGTFVNDRRIQPGRLHALALGDKISLGQGDLVSFIFELS